PPADRPGRVPVVAARHRPRGADRRRPPRRPVEAGRAAAIRHAVDGGAGERGAAGRGRPPRGTPTTGARSAAVVTGGLPVAAVATLPGRGRLRDDQRPAGADER